jgi:hypothetical protein
MLLCFFLFIPVGEDLATELAPFQAILTKSGCYLLGVANLFFTPPPFFSKKKRKRKKKAGVGCFCGQRQCIFWLEKICRSARMRIRE